MNSAVKTDTTGKSFLIFSALMTLVFGCGCVFFGYILMPFAAAFYAALLMSENKHKKLLSIILPCFVWLLNFSFSGPWSLEGITYVLLGLLIYFLYSNNKSKAECAFWSAFLTAIFIIISIIFIAFVYSNEVSLEAVKEFYSSLYYDAKSMFIKQITAFCQFDDEGISYFIFNTSDAESIFNSLVSAIIPALFIISFLISGVALKTFTACLRKFSDKNARIFSWEFSTNSFLAYFYVILAIVNLFVGSSDGTFAFVVSSLSMILMFVYAYLGMKFINSFLREKIGKVPSIIVMGMAVLVFSSFALTLLSYIGVYYTVTINKILKNNSSNL